MLALSLPLVLTPAPAPARAEDAPPPAGASYRLVATWADARPHPAPGPGRFGDVADIGSAPDGALYVLDRAQDALHVFAADGAPRAWWPNPAPDADGGAWRWVRLDVGFDGRPYVLGRGSFAGGPMQPAEIRWRVDVLGADGMVQARHLLGTVGQERYVDLAARADGRVYLTRTSGNVARLGTYAIDILKPDGTKEAPLVPPQFTIPLNLDIAADGTLYVVDQFPHSSIPPAPGKVDGVAIFGPDHAYRETVRFSGAMDVAVGAAGVFVSQNTEIFKLGSRDPLYSGPTVQKNPYRLTSLGVPTMFSLDVPASGPPRLLAAMTHCSFQGVLGFDVGEASNPRPPPSFLGAIDLPNLRGPINPLRVDAGASVEVLQGRFEPAPAATPGGGSATAPFISQLYTADPQTVQHWRPDGALAGQMGACGVWNAPLGVVDVAADGEAAYTINSQAIVRRAGDRPPAWEKYALILVDDPLLSPHLVAVAADGGAVAALDTGSQTVVVVDERGEPVANWSYGAGEDAWTPTDIAMARDVVALAAAGDGAVRTYRRDGTQVAAWHAPQGARGVAIGALGEVVVLGDDGWALRYTAEGRLVTAWPMPDRTVAARDIAVDGAGRVYVPWVDASPAPGAGPSAGPSLDQRVEIRRAGVWVFEPRLAYGELPAAGGDDPEQDGRCLVRADHRAEPTAVRLGEAVVVTLDVDGRCPGHPERTRLVIVFNASESMNNDNGFDRAKSAVIDLLGRLDRPGGRAGVPAGGQMGAWPGIEVALVSFADRATLDVGCTTRLGDVRSAVAGLVAAGGTDLAGALGLAREALACEAGDAAIDHRAVLVVTDGAPLSGGDDPTSAAQALRDAGVALYAQLHPYVQLRIAGANALAALVGGADHVFTDFTPEGADAQWKALTRFAPASGSAFDTAEIEVALGADVRYVAGSAEPAATYDAAAHALRWSVSSAPHGGLPVRYRVEPRRLGAWVPIGGAGGRVDVKGGAAGDVRVDLPNPAVRVRGAGEAYLPVGQR